MIQSCIVALTLVALVIMSVRANRKFADRRRLPMQWSMSGSVNWTAPRAVALAFTPILAALLLVSTTIATVAWSPRPGQEGQVIPVISIMSLCFVAAHALHLWLMGKAPRGNGD